MCLFLLLPRHKEVDHLLVVWRVPKTTPGWDEAEGRHQRPAAWRPWDGQEPTAQVRGKGVFLNSFPHSPSIPLRYRYRDRPLPETLHMKTTGCSNCRVHLW